MSLPIDLPPGIVKTTTANAAPGRWVDGDHMRFKTGRPEKIGGYEEVALDDPLDGPVRGALGWFTQGGTRIANMGTWRRLYTFHAGAISAITPLDASGTLTDPFSTTGGSAIVTVADTTHNRDVGSIVIFDGADSVGGITIDGEYEVTEVVDADSYKITHSAAASFTAGASTNLLQRSQEFDNAYWTKSNILAFGSGSVANDATAPDGTATADKIIENSDAGKARIVSKSGLNFTSGKRYTLSVYLKPTGRTAAILQISNTPFGAGAQTAYFSLTGDGSVSLVVTGCTAEITALSDGWYRCSVTTNIATTTTTASANIYMLDSPTNFAATYDGDGTSGMYLWGAQLEEGAGATGYIPTTSATASRTGGDGGSVDYEYEINPGPKSTAYGVGWGVGPWGAGTWGTPRDIEDAIELDARYWHIQRYMSAILALPTGGTLYFWDQVSGDARAEAISNAPATARAFFLTAEGFPVLLGTLDVNGDFDPMTMRWPDVDDITDWDPSANDVANIRKLELGNKLMAGTAISDDMNIIWSDLAAYAMQYLGEGEIYRTPRLGDNIGIVGPGAFAVANEMVYWMGRSELLMYSVGSGVRSIPNQLDIRDWLFRRLSVTHRGKTFGAYNPKANTIIFGYVSTGHTEPDSYIEVSLDDFSWSVGTLFGDRTALFFHPTPDGAVYMTDSDGALYEHETGHDADGAALEARIKSGMVGLGKGDTDMDVFGVIPDFERQTGDVTCNISLYARPQSSSVIDEASITLAEGAEEEDCILCGRHAQIEFVSDVVGGDFRLGLPRVTVSAAGHR